MPIAQTVRIRPFCTVAVDFVAECGCENADVQKAFLDPNHFSHKAMSRLGPPLNCRKLIAAHKFIEYPSAKILRFQEKSGVSPKKECVLCYVCCSSVSIGALQSEGFQNIGYFHARLSETGEPRESPDVQVPGDIRSRSLNQPNSQGSLGLVEEIL